MLEELRGLIAAVPASCPAKGYLEDVVLPCQGLAASRLLGRPVGGGGGEASKCCAAVAEHRDTYAQLVQAFSESRGGPRLSAAPPA